LRPHAAWSSGLKQPGAHVTPGALTFQLAADTVLISCNACAEGGSNDDRTGHAPDEALAETGNIILNSWVATIANLLKKNLRMSLPVVIRRDQSHIFESASTRDSPVVFLHIKFDISRQQIRGYVALMMNVPSVAELRSLIADYVVSLARRSD
jgi:chemotaxis protein CheY-P-specific phosphatase CheC